MGTLYILFIFCLELFKNANASTREHDHKWQITNCYQSEVVVGANGNSSLDQVLLQAFGNVLTGEKDDDTQIEHCLAVHHTSDDELTFDNYGISARMQYQSTDPDPKHVSGFGLIFNYQDNFNYEYAYLSHSVDENSGSNTTTPVPARRYLIQAGVRLRGQYTNTAQIPLNGSISDSGWHTLSLVIDKDLRSTVQVYLNENKVGSFQETLAPRDVGGVMTLDIYENTAVFEYFNVGRCIKFDSNGVCVETPNKCPNGYNLIGERCFFVSDASEKETYEGALLECKAKRGRLYEPRNGVEYIALGHYLKNTLNYTTSSVFRTWIAISDRKTEGNWVYESDDGALEYTHWQHVNYGRDRGEFNTANDCAFIYGDSLLQWITTYCHYAYRYICEPTI